jgi:hypothetical protein
MSIVGFDAPDFRTISEFRRRHSKALSALFQAQISGFPCLLATRAGARRATTLSGMLAQPAETKQRTNQHQPNPKPNTNQHQPESIAV